MDINSKIRDAFKQRKLREASKWDYESQPNLYELDNFLRKAGYRILDPVYHDSLGRFEFSIEAIKPSYLYPEIMYDVNKDEFYTRVSPSYGWIDSYDVSHLMEGLDTVYGVLVYLDKLDTSKLEFPIEEED